MVGGDEVVEQVFEGRVEVESGDGEKRPRLRFSQGWSSRQ